MRMGEVTGAAAAAGSNGVKVAAVAGRRALGRFIDFPYVLYRGHPYWVPPLRREQRGLLDPKRNPFFAHSQIQPFLAENERGELVGRIAAIVNGEHLKKYHDGVGFFGFFECREDFGVAAALLEQAGAFLRQAGLQKMRGPVSPSLNGMAGCLVGGFDREPSILMPYNPPYYEDFFLKAGMQRVMTTWSLFLHKALASPARAVAGLEEVLRRNPGLSVRSADRRQAPAELLTLLEIYNEAWSENWGHVPFTAAEFQAMFKLCRPLLDPDLVLLLEYEGQTIGFTLALPNLNEILNRFPDGRLGPWSYLKLGLLLKLKVIQGVRLVMTGIRKEFRGRGFDVALCLAAAQRGLAKRCYHSCEFSWILDTNRVALNGLEHFGAIRDKEYAFFERDL